MEKIETVLIIPSLNPDKTLLRVVDSALAAGFVHAVVVNDGSDNAHTPIFAQIAALRGCSVLHHEENKGKGAALQRALIAFFLDCNTAAGYTEIMPPRQPPHKLRLPHGLRSAPERYANGAARHPNGIFGPLLSHPRRALRI